MAVSTVNQIVAELQVELSKKRNQNKTSSVVEQIWHKLKKGF